MTLRNAWGYPMREWRDWERMAEAAEERGDWERARECWYRAAENATTNRDNRRSYFNEREDRADAMRRRELGA